MAYESPAEHPTITDEERLYIEESIGEGAQLLGATEVSKLLCKTSPLPVAEGGHCEDVCNYTPYCRGRCPDGLICRNMNALVFNLTNCFCRNLRHPGENSSLRCLSMQLLWPTSAGAGLSTFCSSASQRTSRRCLVLRSVK